jgi:short-subunit dehydrogenase
MDRDLAVITGASAGMGVEFARQIAARGYDLLLVARRGDRLQQVADTITSIHNVRCDILACDLADESGVAQLDGRLRAADNLGLLVNNAGFGTLGYFWKNSLESQEKMHRLHVMAAMRLCHAALQSMVKRDQGAIMNVSSVAGFVTGPGSISYSATKTWMNRFTEGLSLELELAKSHVKVQALCPGYTRTEFHQALEMDASKIPGWMWLSAERVVRESLDALKTGKLFVIPGRRYRAMLRAYLLLPARARRSIGIRGASRRQRKS